MQSTDLSHSKLVKPKRLTAGDTIGIVAPAGPPPAGELEKGIEIIRSRGYHVRVGDHVLARAGHCDYLAGSDEERASDLNAMFADPEIAAIFCARGGYGSMRLFDLLNWESIRANPKLFLGYSDITSLHTAFGRMGLVTIHATMVSSMWRLDANSLEQFWELVEGESRPGELSTGSADVITIVPGRAAGELTGGNLCLLAQACGSPHGPDFSGKIVLIEDINDAVYRADRDLTQLLNAGLLQQAAGFIIGELTGWEGHEADPPRNTPVALWTEFFGRLGKPTIAGFPFGHIPNPLPLPLGVRASLDATARTVTLMESAVE